MLHYDSIHRRTGIMQFAFSVFACIAYAWIIVEASMNYPGSVPLYFLFTFFAALMLWLSVRHFVGYGQVFLGIFLWLGFWLKLSVHLISGEDYVEPIGGFEFDASGYDELLMVVTVAQAVVCSVWLLAKAQMKTKGTWSPLFSTSGKPVWVAPRLKLGVLFLYALLVVAVNAINWNFGILQFGLVTKTVFIWPTNAIISWLLGDGFSLMSAMLLLAAISNRRHVNLVLVIVLFEAILTSITTLSRGGFLWHALPVLVVIGINWNFFRKIIPRRVLIGLSVLTVLSFSVSLLAANFSRDTQYAASTQTQSDEFNFGESVTKASGLVLDRWVGVEGVMVAVGTRQGFDMFMEHMFVKQETGKLAIFQVINNSVYQNTDRDIFQTGSIPGAVASLYLSGYIAVVIAGMFLLCLCVVIFERWTLVVTQNPFIIAHVGLWLANSVAQFGANPRQWYFSLFLQFITIMFVAYLQSRWLGIGWFMRFRQRRVLRHARQTSRVLTGSTIARCNTR